MEENGTSVKSPKCKFQCAPGNKHIDTITTSEQANRRSSFGLSGDFFDFGRKSLSFSDFNVSDFGKESLGILPPDFGRFSSSFMNLSNPEFGRESLGILQIDAHLQSTDFNIIDEKITIPDILLTAVEESNDYVANAINTALLNPISRKTSSASSTSSLNPFNSRSLEGPSKIYSLSSTRNFEESTKSNIFNKAFCNTDFNDLTYDISSIILHSIHSPFNKGRLFSSTEFHISPARIKSLPATTKESFEDETDITGAIGRHFWTADGTTMKTKTLEKRSFHGVLDFNEEDTSNDFHDSVFIEGHHIAEKIADGSILNDSTGGEIGILDSTPQPEWPDEVSENEDKEKEDVKSNTETIFKNVDKLLPAPILNTNFKIKTSKTDSNSSNENSGDKINISETNKSQTSEKSAPKSISDITYESKKLSISCKSQSKSRDAKELLHNLSEIINCRNPSEQQKSEGQNLINTLADILCETNSNVKNTCLDDSGHSSIIDEQSEYPDRQNDECFEVMDHCIKTTSDIPNEHVSDTSNVDSSSKPIKNIGHGHLIQSFSTSVPNIKTLPPSMIRKRHTSASGLDFNKNKSTTSNNSSVNSNDSKNSSNSSKTSIAGTLRRKTVCYGTKKGPMKAVIPIGDMKKKNSTMATPEKVERKIPSIINRTSTPIKESKLKPMAASTPTGRPMRDKKITSVSPLAQPIKENVSFTMSKDVNISTPLPKSSIKLKPGLVRRNSVSDVKRISENIDRKITRSNSIEKESGIMLSLTRVRQNIVNSPYYQFKKQNVLKENNNIGVSNSKEKIGVNKSLPESKVTNSISKLRRSGKENIWK